MAELDPLGLMTARGGGRLGDACSLYQIDKQNFNLLGGLLARLQSVPSAYRGSVSKQASSI